MFRNKIVLATLFLGLTLGSALGVVLYNFIENFDLNWYIASLMFFVIMEVGIMIYVEGKSAKTEPKKIVNTYMLAKVVKILSALLLAAIYAFVVKHGVKNFMIGFISLYILFLFIESRMFMIIEKHLKENKKEE